MLLQAQCLESHSLHQFFVTKLLLMMAFLLQLLLMKRGGELIYAGPLGPKSRELIKYFEVILFIDASFLVTPIAKYCIYTNSQTSLYYVM